MTDQTPFSALQAEQIRRKQASRPIVASPVPMKKWYSRFNVTGALQYALFIGGLASATVGCGMIYLPLGPIVGGIIAVLLGMLLSTETK